MLAILFASSSALLHAQVGIGTTTPAASSQLEISSTTTGILIPRMTQAQRTAIATPATGLLIYQTDATTGFWYYNGTIWTNFASSGWSLIGDSGTTPATNFLGTTDANDFILATNNAERMRFQTDGDVGIGQNNPTTKLHITGTSPVFRLQDGNQGANKVLTSDANGNAFWGSSASLTGPDADWNFPNPGKTYADPVYHTGPVVIGKIGTTTHELEINNGLNIGTTFGVGNNEYMIDGNTETQFSHRIAPYSDNVITLGSSSFRWRNVYAVNGTIQTSDARDKTNIAPLSYGIPELMKLRPVSYYWKNENYLGYPIPGDKKEKKLGLIAQEVQKIIPEVIYGQHWSPKSEKEHDVFVQSDNKLLGINYEELLPLLIKSKQEQQLEIEKLEKETEALLVKVKAILKKN